MRRVFGLRNAPDPVVFVILALLCASALVIFFHHRALGALDRQTSIILQKVAEQTADAAAADIRRVFDGPVFETLASITHPSLVAGRIDIVARAYRQGLSAYPQVDRFFVWTGTTDERVPDEALFYGPKPPSALPDTPPGLEAFHREPALGRAVVAAARRYADARQIYAAVQAESGGVPYDVFLRMYYTGAARDHFLAILGFVVNLDHARSTLFETIHRTRLANLLEPKDGTPPFEMRVLDEHGRQVFGPQGPRPAISAQTEFALQFYPIDDIRTRMPAVTPDRQWTLVVSPRGLTTPVFSSTRVQSYWLSGVSLLMMALALGFSIRASRRAAQLARMQAEFVAHVSHQLKTPVSLLSAVTETVSLDRVRSPEKLAQCMAIIRGQTSRLSALVERILEYSRIAERRPRYELEAVRLDTLVRETVEAFMAALQTSGYTIDVGGAGGTPIVAADPAALEQALINLLDNAIKYSGQSRTIQVRVGVSGSEAFVEVIDHGIGVPVNERSRILERFYRGSGATVHRNGFGLGLPIANDILRAHRGSLEVDATPGGGSTFRMRLPLLEDAAPVPRRTAVTSWWRREAS